MGFDGAGCLKWFSVGGVVVGCGGLGGGVGVRGGRGAPAGRGGAGPHDGDSAGLGEPGAGRRSGGWLDGRRREENRRSG